MTSCMVPGNGPVADRLLPMAHDKLAIIFDIVEDFGISSDGL